MKEEKKEVGVCVQRECLFEPLSRDLTLNAKEACQVTQWACVELCAEKKMKEEKKEVGVCVQRECLFADWKVL